MSPLQESTVTVDANGNWEFTPTSLLEGIYSYTATVIDSSGILGVTSGPIYFKVDIESLSNTGSGIIFRVLTGMGISMFGLVLMHTTNRRRIKI
jgi:hypothetical protein